ncbi:MAG: efflux RND transporter periplasmic adaptor subunit [Leptothrix sp. (in: Bacteria)]|nr:efflux RND transporter periplasmic adaptor subunit [Leptothrix sp. (in: b-proteobacteria)]
MLPLKPAAFRSAVLAACMLTLSLPGRAAELPSVPVQVQAGAATLAFDGTVEAVRQTVLAAQVAGAIVRLDVKVGDRVAAGQVLMRIDARAAEQTAAASEAQVRAARAGLDVATKDFGRQQQLFKQNFISAAAFDRAESVFKATQAQLQAQIAQAGAARTQSGLHVVSAPFAGVISEVPVQQGDMAMPGRALATLYDPVALRITAAVPQTVARQMIAGQMPRAELPGLPASAVWVTPLRLQQLPTVDPASLSVQLRADLPPALAGVVPGMFARLWLPVAAAAPGLAGAAPAAVTVTVPLRAVVRRAELTAVYVIGADGKPVLRQVRLGRRQGEQAEVLAGLMAGERVVTTPQAAARAQ